jgi:hypothetical protein
MDCQRRRAVEIKSALELMVKVVLGGANSDIWECGTGLWINGSAPKVAERAIGRDVRSLGWWVGGFGGAQLG